MENIPIKAENNRDSINLLPNIFTFSGPSISCTTKTEVELM